MSKKSVLNSLQIWLKRKLEDIRASRQSDAELQHEIARNLGQTKYRLKQQYDPFAVHDEVHCGDCNRLMTKGNTRHLSAIFDHGVRCEDCFAIIEETIKQEQK